MMPPSTEREGRAWIEDLGRSLYHRARPNALYMALTAYFDESGTHGEKSPAVVLGGFIASEANWVAYENDLTSLLNRFGVEVFHARKFRKRQGEFRGWSDQQFVEFAVAFFDLFDKHLGRGIAVAIPTADYKELYRAEKFPAKGRQDSIYGLCFRFCLLALINFAKDAEYDWPVTIVLESGHPNAGDAVRIFDEIKSKVLKPECRSVLGAVAFDSKEACPQLASADAMVHVLYQSKVDPAGWEKARVKSMDFIPAAAGLPTAPKSRIHGRCANFGWAAYKRHSFIGLF